MTRRRSPAAESADPAFVVADNEGSKYVVHNRSLEAAAEGLPLTDQEQALYSAAFNGLNAGDLGPLVAYLRSPYRLHPSLARLLADCIDHPDAFWRIPKPKRGRRLRGTLLDAILSRQRIASIGYFIENALPQADNQMESVVEAAMKVPEFKLKSRPAVFALWKKYLRYRNEGRIQNGFWMGSRGAEGVKSIRHDG